MLGWGAGYANFMLVEQVFGYTEPCPTARAWSRIQVLAHLLVFHQPLIGLPGPTNGHNGALLPGDESGNLFAIALIEGMKTQVVVQGRVAHITLARGRIDANKKCLFEKHGGPPISIYSVYECSSKNGRWQ